MGVADGSDSEGRLFVVTKGTHYSTGGTPSGNNINLFSSSSCSPRHFRNRSTGVSARHDPPQSHASRGLLTQAWHGIAPAGGGNSCSVGGAGISVC